MARSDDQSDDTLLLAVHGMTCAGCVSTAERVLRQVPGIRAVKVDFEGKRALVRGRADSGAAIASLRRAGFEAAVIAGEARQPA